MSSPQQMQDNATHNRPVTGEMTRRFIINGTDRFGISKDVTTVFYPADQATIVGECYNLAEEHIPLVLDAARQGAEAWRRSTMTQRQAVLENLASLLDKHQTDLSRLITLEAGKPITLSRQEVARAASLCRLAAARLANETEQRYVLDDAAGGGRVAVTRRFPVGPVLAITPFNFPLNLAMHKLVPAIAGGCSLTLKPAPQTPLTALYLGHLAVEAGYPYINVVPASEAIAERLVTADTFRLVSFTGSDRVGWHLRGLAKGKPVHLECGGTCAVIVDALARPVREIAERVAYGAFAYAGQICVSVQQILVRSSLADELTVHLRDAARALVVGDPMADKTLVGPMIRMDDVRRSRDVIKTAINAGGNVLYGGNTWNMFTLNPTLMDRITPEMALWRQEVFAPIAVLKTYDTLDEAIRLVNSSRYGLHAGAYVSDRRDVEKLYADLEVGGLVIDDIPTYRHDLPPYGGLKYSGDGREGAACALSAYTVDKTLYQPH